MATMDETRSCWGDRLVVSVFLYNELCNENDSSQLFQGSRHFRLEFGTRVAKVLADASPVVISAFESPVEGCTQVQHDLQCTLMAGCMMSLPLPVLKENQLWEAPLKEGMRHFVTVLPDRFEGVGFDRLLRSGRSLPFHRRLPQGHCSRRIQPPSPLVVVRTGRNRAQAYHGQPDEDRPSRQKQRAIPDKGSCRQSSNGHDELERSPPGPVQRALGQSRSDPPRRAIPSSLHIHGNFPHQEREV